MFICIYRPIKMKLNIILQEVLQRHIMIYIYFIKMQLGLIIDFKKEEIKNYEMADGAVALFALESF